MDISKWPKLKAIALWIEKTWPVILHRLSETARAGMQLAKRVMPGLLRQLYIVLRAIIILAIQLVSWIVKFAVKTLTNIVTSATK